MTLSAARVKAAAAANAHYFRRWFGSDAVAVVAAMLDNLKKTEALYDQEDNDCETVHYVDRETFRRDVQRSRPVR